MLFTEHAWKVVVVVVVVVVLPQWLRVFVE